MLPRRSIGSTGLDVPVLAFGGVPLGGLFSQVDDADARACVACAAHGVPLAAAALQVPLVIARWPL